MAEEQQPVFTYAAPPPWEVQWEVVRAELDWGYVRQLRRALYAHGLWPGPSGTVAELQASARAVLELLVASPTMRGITTGGWSWTREAGWYALAWSPLVELDVRESLLEIGDDGRYR